MAIFLPEEDEQQPTGTCTECFGSFPQTRKDRKTCSLRCKRKRIYREREADKPRYWEDTTEHCAICESSFPNEEQLTAHMKQAHNRLIAEYDINRADEARQDKLRAIQADEDALFDELLVTAAA